MLQQPPFLPQALLSTVSHKPPPCKNTRIDISLKGVYGKTEQRQAESGKNTARLFFSNCKQEVSSLRSMRMWQSWMYNGRASTKTMTLIPATSVCACSQLAHFYIYREDNKAQQATSLCLCFSFFPLLFHLALSLWQQAWSHLSNPTTNTQTRSADTHTHHFKATKTPCCGSGSAFFLSFGFPLPTNAIAEQRNFPSKLYEENCLRDLQSRQIFYRYAAIFISSSAKRDFKLTLAREQLKRMERGEKGFIEMKT